MSFLDHRNKKILERVEILLEKVEHLCDDHHNILKENGHGEEKEEIKNIQVENPDCKGDSSNVDKKG